MATVTKRGRSYRIRAYAGYDVNGRQIEKTTTWTPPEGWSEKRAAKEAQRQAVLFEEQIRTGQIVNGKIRFCDFAQMWFSRYAEAQLRPRTVARYRELLPRINSYIGHIPIEKIRPSHLLDFYAELEGLEPGNATYCCTVNLKSFLKDRDITQVEFSQKHGVSLTTLRNAWHGQPISRKSAERICNGLNVAMETCFTPAEPNSRLSSTTVRHYHSLISDILGDAVSWQYIPYNPCGRIDAPRAASPDIQYLDDVQARHLVTLLKREEGIYRRPILLLLLTGMRRGELLGLEWQDIDWNQHTLRIERTSQYLPGVGVFTDETKNKSSRRIINVPPQVMTILQEQLQWQLLQARHLEDCWNDSGRVITAEDGNPMRPDRLSVWFSKFIRRTDLPKIKIHSLRHTYATLAISSGAAITAVAAQLGHANIATTTTIYAHAIKSAQIAAAQKIGCIVEDIL